MCEHLIYFLMQGSIQCMARCLKECGLLLSAHDHGTAHVNELGLVVRLGLVIIPNKDTTSQCRRHRSRCVLRGGHLDRAYNINCIKDLSIKLYKYIKYPHTTCMRLMGKFKNQKMINFLVLAAVFTTEKTRLPNNKITYSMKVTIDVRLSCVYGCCSNVIPAHHESTVSLSAHNTTVNSY